MTEFVVHFTRASDPPAKDPDRPYWDHLSILHGHVSPSEKRWGVARHQGGLGDSQRAVCFAEVPLPFVGRIADRRRARFGIGFARESVRRQRAGRVWHLDKDEPAAKAFEATVRDHRARFDPADPLWKLTPLVGRPGLYRMVRARWVDVELQARSNTSGHA